jgi:hypothetical protein
MKHKKLNLKFQYPLMYKPISIECLSLKFYVVTDLKEDIQLVLRSNCKTGMRKLPCFLIVGSGSPD